MFPARKILYQQVILLKTIAVIYGNFDILVKICTKTPKYAFLTQKKSHLVTQKLKFLQN